MAHIATVKRGIKVVELTVKVKATRINENGTFSGFEVVSASGPNKTFKVVAPPQGGGAIYLKVESLDNITISEGIAPEKTEKKKLF